MSVTITSKRHKTALAVTATAALLTTGGALASAAPTPLPYHGTIQVVHASDTSWVPMAYECVDGGADLIPRQSMVVGPQRAPFGVGSHRMVIGQSTVQTELYRTPQYDGTPLSNLTRLAYSTYARSRFSDGPDRQLPYLRVNVDSDSTDGVDQRDASLFFFPSNNGDQQAIVNRTWQHWNVFGGKVNVDGDTGPGGATTIEAYAAAHPNAVLFNNDVGKPTGGAIATIVGCALGGNEDSFRNGVYFTDRVIVGKNGQDTLFNFEPDVTVTNAGTATKVVDPEHLRRWVQQAFSASTDADLIPKQRFVRGPATPPLGVGSLRFTIGDNPDRVEQFRTPRYDDRLLRDLRGLRYATYQRGTGATPTFQQPAYLRLSLDNDQDGTRDESIFFIPTNNPAQGPVLQSTWQHWNAYRGVWNLNSDEGTSNAVTLKSYLVEHPDSTIINNNAGLPSGGGLAVMVGASGDNQRNGQFYVDDILVRTVDAATSTTVSGIRFDLEPSAG